MKYPIGMNFLLIGWVTAKRTHTGFVTEQLRKD